MNNEVESKLNELLKMKEDLDELKSERKQQETIDEFDKKQKKLRCHFWIWLVACTAFEVCGIVGLFLNTGRYQVISLFWALVGFNSTILLKIWYHTMHTKISILQELKKTQIQIAELAMGKED